MLGFPTMQKFSTLLSASVVLSNPDSWNSDIIPVIWGLNFNSHKKALRKVRLRGGWEVTLFQWSKLNIRREKQILWNCRQQWQFQGQQKLWGNLETAEMKKKIVAVSDSLLRGMKRSVGRLSWTVDKSVVTQVLLFMTGGIAQ